MKHLLINSSLSFLCLQIFCSLSILAEPLKAISGSTKITLKSEKINLPQDSKVFTGVGSNHLNQYCLICHSCEYLNDQPALTRNMWEKEVLKMKSSYGAPIPDADIKILVEELYQKFGAPIASKK